MDFVVRQSDFVRELALTQGVVEKKTTIPILANVLIETGKDVIHLTATDLELGIRCSCPAKVNKAGSGTIPAKRLMDYIRLLPNQDVNLKMADNQWANISCGRSRSRIPGMSKDNYPELPAKSRTMAKIPVAALQRLISRTLFAISMEESRFTLNGAQLLLSDKNATMVATDGHRLALTAEPMANPTVESGTVFKALVPRKAMNELMKMCSGAEADAVFEFGADDNHLFFELGDRQLLSRKLTGNFPDFDKVLPKSHEHHISINRDDFRGMIERVAQFAEERSKAIRVKLGDGELKVFATNAESGESEDSIATRYDGPRVDIGFNAQYLMDFLRVTETPEIQFHFKDGNSAGELEPGATDEDKPKSVYRYVVMPMRI
jgi:DNA polymerase III subunit beta